MTAILEKYKLSYVAVPKVACTSLKTMMFEVENGYPFKSFSTNGKSWWIHDLYASIPFGDLPHEKMADHRRLTVVRDPVQRLLSCYSNRVVHHRELSREKARRPLRESGLPFSPDLSTFVANLEGYMKAVRSIHHHARPMVDYLGRDPAYFSRVYKMSELPELVDDVAALCGHKVALERLQTGGPKIAADALSAEELARLRDFYAADYESYGSKL